MAPPPATGRALLTRAAALAGLALLASLVLGQPAPPVIPEGLSLDQPLTLADCVRIALAANPTVLTSGNNLRQATAAVTQARSAQLPNLSLQADASATRRRASSGSGGGLSPDTSSTSWGTDLVLSQTLYQSGLSEGVRSARASARAAGLGLDDTRRSVALDVAQSYYAALAAAALVDVAGRTLESSTQHVEFTRAGIAADALAPADLYPFEVEVAQARLAVIVAENQAQTSLTDLKAAIGLPAGTPLRLAEALGRPPLPESLPDLLETAYRERPDIRRQSALIEAARLNLRVAQIERGPVLGVTGDASYGVSDGSSGTAGQITAGVTLPLFDGGLTRARADSARAALDSAQQALQDLQIAVGAEVEFSFLNAVEASNRIDVAETAVRAAEVSLDAAETKYAETVGIPVEVTDAEVNLRQAQVDRVQAYYDYNTALAALQAALGRLPVPDVP